MTSKILKITLTIFFIAVCIELNAMAYYFFEYGALPLNYPPITVGTQWINPELKVAGINFKEQHPVLHPYFSSTPKVRDILDGKMPTDMAHLSEFVRQGNVYLPSQGEYIIGIFGGSVAESFAYYLQNLLREPPYSKKKYVVLNYAMGGIKQPLPAIQLAYALSVGQHIDMVLVLNGYNEFQGGYTNVEKGISINMPAADTQFIMDWIIRSYQGDEKERTTHALIVATTGILNTVAEYANATKLASVRVVCSLFIEVINNYLTGFKSTLAQKLSFNTELSYFSMSFATEDEKKHTYKSIASMLVQSARTMKTLCESSGISFYNFLHPNQYFSTLNIAPGDEKRILSNPQNLTEIPKIYSEYAEAIKNDPTHSVINASDILDGQGSNLFQDDCCHMSIDGNKELARYILDKINLPK